MQISHWTKWPTHSPVSVGQPVHRGKHRWIPLLPASTEYTHMWIMYTTIFTCILNFYVHIQTFFLSVCCCLQQGKLIQNRNTSGDKYFFPDNFHTSDQLVVFHETKTPLLTHTTTNYKNIILSPPRSLALWRHSTCSASQTMMFILMVCSNRSLPNLIQINASTSVIALRKTNKNIPHRYWNSC